MDMTNVLSIGVINLERIQQFPHTMKLLKLQMQAVDMFVDWKFTVDLRAIDVYF
jgi:hypothetical protein